MVDWGTSVKSNYCWDRVFFWLWDANNCNDYRIATYKDPKDRPEAFQKYVPGKLPHCRQVFQLDKALARINAQALSIHEEEGIS